MPFTNTDLINRETEIRNLQQSGPEKRSMALGPHYADLQLTPEAFSQVEEKLRVARLFEVTTMSQTMRTVEIDEQRRLVMERRTQETDLKERWLEELHRLRERAYEVLVHDAEAVKADEQRRLEADRRAVLNIEKSRITEKRERFEASQSQSYYGGGGMGGGTTPRGGGNASGAGGRATSPSVGGSSLYAANNTTTNVNGTTTASSLNLPPNPNKAPLLVMNITLGNGREDKLTVRANDDPKRVAVVFAKKHRLPDAAINNLTNQIRSHLNARTATAVSTSSVGAAGGGASMSMGASSLPMAAGGGSYSMGSAHVGGAGGAGSYSYGGGVDSRNPSQSPAPSTGFRSSQFASGAAGMRR